MALDTGSTHATIDSNTLYLLDYNIRDNIGKVEVETANGIIKTGIFEIGVFTSIGITRKEFQIQAMIFLLMVFYLNMMAYSALISLKK